MENRKMTENQRVAIVTGAAGGIGRAMTRALLAAGIRVAGVDRDREPLEALAASAREQGKGSELLTLQTDLSKDSAAEEITGATRDRFGPVDILVNNAGIGPGAIRPDSWQRPLKFSVHAAAHQLDANLTFEIADLAAEGRLRCVQPFLSRERHAALLGNGDEITKMP
jgi:NAD(P)-dependent dehydrogenase (short-subunit alcohol dehydrogenase family)